MNAARAGILERLASGEILVCDGGLGSLLLARGLSPGECPEAWTLSHPDVLEEIARSYRDAGADILETNTFGASPLKLALYGLEGRMEEMNRRAVEIVRGVAEGPDGAARGGSPARVARDRGAGGAVRGAAREPGEPMRGPAFVAACCGPSARILKPYGDTEPGAVFESFVRQMRVLFEAGVDAILIETMTDLAEAALAVKAAKTVSPSLPVLATMTFDRTRRGFFTIMGTSIEAAAAGLAEAGADGVGSNCGNGIENMVEIAREFRRYTKLPVVIQSNAGLPEIAGDRAVYSETPEFMAERSRALVEMGVSVMGGCCGTTPEHIRALREVVDAARPRS